jgi:hypothetical protein
MSRPIGLQYGMFVIVTFWGSTVRGKELMNKSHLRTVCIILASLAGFTQSASAITITFDNPTEDQFVSVESEGFRFTGPVVQVQSSNALDGNAVSWAGATPSEDVDPFVMSSISGAVFDLLSFDISEFFFGVGDTIEFFGFTATGGIVNRTISIQSYTLNSFVFDATWTNLERLEAHAGASPSALVLDNIVVNVVPIPASVWLFGSALAGLGWVRRRQTT